MSATSHATIIASLPCHRRRVDPPQQTSKNNLQHRSMHQPHRLLHPNTTPCAHTWAKKIPPAPAHNQQHIHSHNRALLGTCNLSPRLLLTAFQLSFCIMMIMFPSIASFFQIVTQLRIVWNTPVSPLKVLSWRLSWQVMMTSLYKDLRYLHHYFIGKFLKSRIS